MSLSVLYNAFLYLTYLSKLFQSQKPAVSLNLNMQSIFIVYAFLHIIFEVQFLVKYEKYNNNNNKMNKTISHKCPHLC